MLHPAVERALEIELDSFTFRLVSPSDALLGSRLLFGGSFDPPHIGHQALLESLVSEFPDATLTLIPVHTHAFGKNLAPFESRHRWCELLAKSISSRIEVSDIEATLDGSSLSTVQHFQALEPDRRLVWVIGSDLLPTLSGWKGAEVLSQLVEFCVFQRAGARTSRSSVSREVNLPEISSTDLRVDLARGTVPKRGIPKVILEDFLKDNPYLDRP